MATATSSNHSTTSPAPAIAAGLHSAGNPLAFTPVQQSVLDALAAGASKNDAAKAANVHRSTVHTWEETIPGFHDAVEAAKAAYRAELSSQLRRVSVKAINALEFLIDDSAVSPSVRFRAIQFALTRPRFPDKEWALPENLNPAPIQKVQESLALLAAETKAAGQYDKLKAKNVENVEQLRHHFPVTRHIPIGENPSSGKICAEHVEIVESPPARTPQAEPIAPTLDPGSRSSSTPSASSQVARNALCPCGSGEKYKRCCGKGAPPLLNHQARCA